MIEGKPVVGDPYFDVLLSDVKNTRREGEEGVVTLGEIAADMGFQNRCEVHGAAAIIQSPLNGVVRGRYSRCFVPCVIKFRSKTIKTAFLVDNGVTCTYLGKPTWDKLIEGLEDVGGNTLRVTLNGEKLGKKSPSLRRIDTSPTSTSSELISSITWKLASVSTTKQKFVH